MWFKNRKNKRQKEIEANGARKNCTKIAVAILNNFCINNCQYIAKTEDDCKSCDIDKVLAIIKKIQNNIGGVSNDGN